MSDLYNLQNPNQFSQTGVVGLPGQLPNRGAQVQILPASTATIQVGTVLKLVPAVGERITVDSAAATDLAWAVVNYKNKANTYSAGETLQVYIRNDFIWLQASAAITRGSKVQFNNDDSNGPTVATLSGSNTSLGIAVTQATNVGDLVLVEILPEAHDAS